MTIEFNCPHCDKLLRTPDDKAGRSAKCPGCGEPISVPAPEIDEDYGLEDDDAFGGFGGDLGELERSADAAPRGKTKQWDRGETKSCPMCGEEVKAAAIRCRHCGEDLEPSRGVAGAFQNTPITVGEVFDTSWKVFQANAGLAIGSLIVVIVMNIVSGLPANILNGVVEAGQIEPGVGFAAALIACQVLAWLVQMWVTIGQTLLFLKMARGDDAEIGDLFRGAPYLLRGIGNSIIFGLAVFAGLILLIVPGIYVALMFGPFMFCLVDRNSRGLECLNEAKMITEGNRGTLFLLAILQALIVFAGFVALCVGALVAVPLVSVMQAVAYLQMSGQPTALTRR